MKLSYHGHSIVYFEHNDKKVIIDPFISNNENTDLNVDNLEVDYILLTHGHNDHVGDTIELAKKNNATIIAIYELAGYLETQGLDVVPMHMGGEKEYDFGSIKFVQAFHSSSFTDHEGNVHYTGMPSGIIVTLDDYKFYHMGDTALFSDIQLISKVNGPFDTVFIPVGDHFTMGIKDATIAVNDYLNTQRVVPIHYNTFPQIEVNVEQFKNDVNVDCLVLSPGDEVK